MTCQHCYFASYDSISSPTPSNVWFATWSYGGTVSFSQTAPHTPDGVTTFAAAVICEDTPRNDLAPLGTTKQMPPPIAAFSANGLDDFQDQFKGWTTSVRGHEIPADA